MGVEAIGVLELVSFSDNFLQICFRNIKKERHGIPVLTVMLSETQAMNHVSCGNMKIKIGL